MQNVKSVKNIYQAQKDLIQLYGPNLDAISLTSKNNALN